MDPNAGIASRTRRKREAHLLSLLYGGSSGDSSQGKTGRKRRRWRMQADEPDAVFLGEKVGKGEKAERVSGGEATAPASAAGASSLSSKSKVGLKAKREAANDDVVCLGESLDERESVEQRRESFVAPPPKEVIEIVDSDDNDTDNGPKEGMERSEDAVDDDMGEKDEQVRGSYVVTEKAESSGDGEPGLVRENPITIDLDGDSESEEESEDNETDSEFYCSSSSETRDYGESSDEDFCVSEGSSGGDNSSSYDDEDEKDVRERIRNNKYKKKKKQSSGPRAEKSSVFDEGTSSAVDQERNVETESSAICNKNGESTTSSKKKDNRGVEEELEDTPSSAQNDECGEQDQEIWRYADCASVISGSRERQTKGCSTKLNGVRGKKVAKKSAVERVERTDENGVADVEVFGNTRDRFCRSKAFKGEVEKDKEKQSSWRGRQGESLETEKRGSPKIFERMENENERVENKEREKEREATMKHKGWVNSRTHARKARVDSKTGCRDWEHNGQQNPSRPKDVHLIELLAECFGGKRSPIRDGSSRFEEKDDDVHQLDSRSPSCVEALPSKFTCGVKMDAPVEKTESEKELDMIWEEMYMCLRLLEVDSLVGSAGTTEAGQNRESPATGCKHNICLDEQIGIHCIACGWLVTDIKDIMPPFVEERPNAGSRRRESSDGVDVSPIDEAQFDASDGGSEAACPHDEGTVWDLIPDVKQNLYAHQQEGFEFLWTNLAGTIDLVTLKSADPSSAGGCIISHAPGTGKTRLTIVFLQTYLEVFPKCHPVIIAPASLLLNWEDEFKKWDIGIPFHNLNNPELSGKEQRDALNKVDWSPNPNKNKEDIRMVKLYSWFKEKSILGISYNLYEKTARDDSKAKKGARKKNRNEGKEKRHETKKEKTAIGVMGKILREIPGLLVLDEGHTPRNQRSLIWKVLSEIQTQKRIILSGTPFQNNFLELYNTLCLVKPSFPDMIPHELKKFCQSRLLQEKKAPEGLTWEPVSSGKTTGMPADDKIGQLKLLMDPFVHVHKGSILQKNLLGLRDCVVTLIPDNMQKALLEGIDCSQNTLKFDHKLALVSAHPSLFLCCSLSEKEESVVDRDHLERDRLNPYVGVKTRFLVEFARLCEAVNEKVLVFSQFIDPLCLIKEQLRKVFSWTEGKELLYMSGKLDKKQRQLMIHGFNDANSQAKILLASTKACSEGINLVGASRVVLLDVVWNPSVERQAISRAYRLGQKKVVYTYHLVTHGTSEYEKYRKQAKKDRLSELVFSARNTEDDEPKSPAAVIEDEVLDMMVRHEKLKDMFGECVVHPKDRDLSEMYGF